mmetsp:Transcript_21220/g.68467  ORF Transcript_21220/g.68467 Transcript_21220/m.68467 type:complete len:92 (+) Transcript_21220:94-369(+)
MAYSQATMVMLSKVVKGVADSLGTMAERISPTGLTRSGLRVGTRESFEVLNTRKWDEMRHPNYFSPLKEHDASVRGVATPGRILNSTLKGD